MKILLIINHGPYGTEFAFNALRLALALQKASPDNAVWIFLLSDGVTCALPNQLRPDGNYNIENMLREAIADGAEVKACTTCIDHRGLFTLSLIEGVKIGSMPELAEWVMQADRVLMF